MKLGINISHLQIPEERQVTALHKIILNADRYFLQSNLRQMNIPGRTRIYNDFGWSMSTYADREGYQDYVDGREERQRQAVRTILDHSDFRDWAKDYMLHYNIGNFLEVFSAARVNLDGFAIRVQREVENA